MKQKTTDCIYPNCTNCTQVECDKEEKDIAALLKRRRWRHDPEKFQRLQQKYRQKIVARLPHCDECEECVLIEETKKGLYIRLCVADLRLIERKVCNCPHWCQKRK